MQKMKQLFLFLFIILTYTFSFSQVVINEVSNSNGNTLIDNLGNTPDWIEIYNKSNSTINLEGYGLSDKRSEPLKWIFPSIELIPNSFTTLFASGNLNVKKINHYETAVYPTTNWKYIIADANTPLNWYFYNFSSASWSTANLGIGYGDGDDATDIINPTNSIYTISNFNVTDTSKITEAILDIDYDDGFVAYLNGIEIARAGLTGMPPLWDELASDHEALIYQAGNPTRIIIDYNTLKSALKNGNNKLAIEVHNSSTTSSDMSLIPFLTFGFIDETIYYDGLVHDWFDIQAASMLETNFTIKSEGETVYLSDPNGIILDSIAVPDLEANMSFGKQNDGEDSTFYFQIPTPNQSNNSSQGFISYEANPSINFVGGFYQNEITVHVINNSLNNGKIRYTLNGQNPTLSSPLCPDSLNISTNTVLKIICFPIENSILPSQTVTESYFFMEDFTIPVISLTTDDINLYGTDGIFDNNWSDWKKPCFVEYYDKDGIKKFDTRASIKCDGGAGGSRTNPQHSVTIEATNKTYGENEPIEYPLIPEKSYIHTYHAFYLRNGSNMWNQYPQKDATFMRIMRETEVNSQAYSPAVVYLNGEYFGVYEIREKANAEYFEENYGNDRDSLDLLSISYFYAPSVIRTIEGSDSSFFNMRNLVTSLDPNSDDFFDLCHEKIDLYSFSDYLAGENWFANYDWIYNNMKIFRTREKGNRWRFNLQDMEIGLGTWGDYNSDLFDYLETQNLPNPFNEIYLALMQNEKFRNYYLNRYADLMNTVFQSEYYLPLTMEMYNELLPEMPRHFERWTGDVPGGMALYEENLNIILNQFEYRTPVVRNQIVSRFNLEKQVDVTLNVSPPGAGYIKISTIVPENLPWTGVYFDGVPVEITAIPNPGYEFISWQQNSEIPINELENNSLNLNINSDDLFLALFYGDSMDLALTISEINYNSDSSINGGNWIELHNFSSKDLSLGDWDLKSKNHYEKYTFPLQTKIPANGYLVVCEDTNLFKSIYPNVTNFVGSTQFSWSNSFDSILIYNSYNQLKVSAIYRDSLPYPECADGWGRTLELKSNETSLIDTNAWFCGCVKGSPGEKYKACEEKLIISEINYYNVDSPNNAGDWIEIKNTTNEEIDLANYVFKDEKNSHTYTLPSFILTPDSYVVLYSDETAFINQHPNVSNKIGGFDFGLSDKSEVLRIYDNNGILTNSMLYKGTAPWSTIPAKSNYTLEYKDSSIYLNPNEASSWFAGCFQGSPGRAFSDCFTVVSQFEDFSFYPNPTTDDVWVIFNNEKAGFKPFEISIVDLNGKIIFKKQYNSTDTIFGEKINVSHYDNGMYFFNLILDDQKHQKPFVKL
jgi:hypothetical protein